MVVVQTELTDEEARALQELAQSVHLPVERVIHSAVTELLALGRAEAAWGPDIQAKRKRARAVSGRFRSDVTDLAANHDKYLVQAFES